MDFKFLANTIAGLPRIASLVAEDDMISRVEAVSPEAMATLSWLLLSNEGYLELLPAHQQLKTMGTTYQFRIHGGPVAREQAFLRRPRQHLNTFGFHGSSLASWHSILRTGLRIGKNSGPFDYHGAAAGSGIYIANTSSTSGSYTGPGGESWAHSMFGSNTSCIALCELNGSPSRGGLATRGGLTEPSACTVYPDETQVALRYLFVYTKTGAVPHVRATDLKAQLNSMRQT